MSLKYLVATSLLVMLLCSSLAFAETAKGEVKRIPRSVSGGSHSATTNAVPVSTEIGDDSTPSTEDVSATRARLANPESKENKPSTIHVVRRGQSGGSAMADQIAVGSEAKP